MPERLLSVGLDVGTTSTQLVFSELSVENRAGAFSVPELAIARRRVLYQSEVYFTPLLGGELVDAHALRQIVDREYARAGFCRSDIDTGAIIITGETSRRENARSVLSELSGYAGDFVVAAAGPDLESILAARGAGATAYSERTGKTVLHMDIGGGTSNLALIRNGAIVETTCFNVGGRLIRLDDNAVVTYVSPVLSGLCPLKVGDCADREGIGEIADFLCRVLEMAAGLREPSDLLERFHTRGASAFTFTGGEDVTISFSGGVAECIAHDTEWLLYGDIGAELGRAIRRSRLCRGQYVLGEQTIRATVIGAGCHSTQLSGSTVFFRGVRFPLKNLPVIRMEHPQARTLSHALAQSDGTAVLSFSADSLTDYASIRACAEEIARGFGENPVCVCTERDVAKALGQAVALCLPPEHPVLLIDRVRLDAGNYLDVASPVGAALPVVVKTLILER